MPMRPFHFHLNEIQREIFQFGTKGMLNSMNCLSFHRDPGYSGKYVSILGDSISTLDGWVPEGYKVFYKDERCEKSGVFAMEDTWWGILIQELGAKLLVNNSWSGSRVTKLPDSPGLFPSGCSDERTGTLHTAYAVPDIILVYLGTNDWIFGARYAAQKDVTCDNLELFGNAYAAMLTKLKNNYPKAEIWCCTIPSSYMEHDPEFRFSEVYYGDNIRIYNTQMKETANQLSCRVLDLYSQQIPYDSIDGTHPTKRGMHTLASLMIRCMNESKS